MVADVKQQCSGIRGQVTKRTRGMLAAALPYRTCIILEQGNCNPSHMGNEKKSVKASGSVKRQRKLRFLRTRARELKMIVKALISTKHPVLVHIIPMRRCNLDCEIGRASCRERV